VPGLFTFPHAIRIVRENGRDVVWLCMSTTSSFRKFTTDGQLLQTIGEKGARSDTGVPADDFSSAAYKKVTHGGGPLTADRHCLRPGRLDVHDRRLRQRPRPQILTRRQIPVLLGRAGHGTRPIQPAATACGSTGAGGCWWPIGKNDRVQVFDQNGKLLNVWPIELIGPAFFYVDADDAVYIPSTMAA